MSSKVTDQFIDYLLKKRTEISEEVIDKARLCKIDYAAVTAAGAAKNRDKWKDMLKLCSGGKAEIFGYSEKTDSRTAAFINGFNAHSLELDDGHRFGMIHLGASVISAIEAVSGDIEINETQKYIGIVMGYEAACRLAMSLQPSHKQLGFHAAGTCGTVGAAMGVAFALNMKSEQMKRVLTAAAGSSAGLLEIQEQKSELKPYNLGKAAMNGLLAAFIGLTGFEPPDDILGGERGFCHLYSRKFDEQKLLMTAEYFEIERIYLKLYASCRHSHSAAEAAIHLHQKVDAEDIENVNVRTYKLAVKGHDHTDILGTASAKLSTPYAVAAGLIYGRADLAMFEPVDPKIADFAKKVEVREDSQLTELSPGKRVAIVTVRMKNGEMFTERVDYAKGDPENPLTEEEFAQKVRELKQYSENTIGGLYEQYG